MNLNSSAIKALDILEAKGYEAFVVGGAVRDFVLCQEPPDVDIATNALPEDIIRVFSPECKVIETGLKHGTVTVIINSFHMEITTYRVDGEYSDNRRPDRVFFTENILEDLGRRDFTVNAMAYSPKSGILDPFGGAKDLENKIIQCVGDPKKRFAEDALRIMRALRFASVLGFGIEPDTKKAVHESKNLLENIAKERISAELVKLLCGQNAKKILLEYTDVLGVFMPDILALKGFDQHNSYHIYDVLTHTGTVVENVEPVSHLRLSALLHDIGKPRTFLMDEKGVGHFKGHCELGEIMARDILHSLRFDNSTISKVCTLVKYHDINLPAAKKSIKKWLGKIGEESFFDLLKLKKADILGQNPAFIDRINMINDIENLAVEIIAENECFSLKQLEISGRDLINTGISGRNIGLILKGLLDMVMEDKIENSKEMLISKALEIISEIKKN